MSTILELFATFMLVLAAVMSAIAAWYSAKTAARSHVFQTTVAKNTVLNLKYQNEIKHLQNLINNFSEIRAWTFDNNNKNRNVELDRLIDNMKLHVNVLE